MISKKIQKIVLSIASVTLIVAFVFPAAVHGQAAQNYIANKVVEVGGGLVSTVLAPIAVVLLGLTSLLVHISGTILNYVINYTVVNMADNLTNLGVIDHIWSTVRDLSNMFFIFILLYAAIRTIIGQETKTKELIVNMVVAAILVNFSLFLTKVIIDVSNILAVTFYEAVAPGSGGSVFSSGLANTFTDLLGITSLFKVGPSLSMNELVTVGVMGSIILLVSSFIFFAVAVMFLVRFIALIFTMVLSPIAFVSYILPGLKDMGEKWRKTLFNQAFFAPVYFFLTWITVYVIRGIVTGLRGTSPDLRAAIAGTREVAGGAATYNPGAVPTMIAFGLAIGFLIASLTTAKSMANKGHSAINTATSWITGKGIGATAFAGRATFGRAGAAIADSEYLKNRANEGGFTGATARMYLAAGNKAGKASFDVRNTSTLGKALDAGKPKKNASFLDDVKESAKNAGERAKIYKPSDAAKVRLDLAVKTRQEEYSKAKEDVEKRVDAAVGTPLTKDLETKKMEARRKAADTSLSDAERAEAKAEVDRINAEIDKEKANHKAERDRRVNELLTPQQQKVDEAKMAAKDTFKNRAEKLAQKEENSLWGKLAGGNRERAAAIRKAANKKSEEEEFAEAAKKLADKQAKEKKDAEGEQAPEAPTSAPKEDKK